MCALALCLLMRMLLHHQTASLCMRPHDQIQVLSMRPVQEAYVKGVSAWNFDVAALKAEAEAEAEPMPTIPEAPRAPISKGQALWPQALAAWLRTARCMRTHADAQVHARQPAWLICLLPHACRFQQFSQQQSLWAAWHRSCAQAEPDFACSAGASSKRAGHHELSGACRLGPQRQEHAGQSEQQRSVHTRVAWCVNLPEDADWRQVSRAILAGQGLPASTWRM